MPLSNKTVFVLGAGFSKPADYPLQSEIIPSLKELELMDFSPSAFEAELDARNIASEFISQAFPKAFPTLEDVFTLLDQTIHDEGFYITGWRDLYLKRESLKKAIWALYKNKQGHNKKTEFYEYLAAALIKQRIDAGQAGDPFSFISLNWDTLLEDSVYESICKVKGLRKLDIDYCCRTTPFDSKGPHTPSILQKSRGIYNLKLLKLHGSVNWMHCPNCGLLYTTVGDSVGSNLTLASRIECRNCRRRYGEGAAGLPTLEHLFVTPTFLKVFDNVHLKMIWHNAYHELAEAAEVVFIGYSFPDADYHLRALLKRALSPKCKITVVLTSGDKKDKTVRYQNFFGLGKVDFKFYGVEQYFLRKWGKGDVARRIQRIYGHLRKQRL